MDNKVALSYLVKMEDTHNKDLFGLSKQIWNYLQPKKITITTGYLPGHLNVTADWESRNFQDKRDWKLSPKVLAKICQKLGTLSVDLFFLHPGYLINFQARCKKSGNQCHVSTMGKNVPIRLSPIQSNTPSIVEAKEKRDHNDIGGTNMAITSMVFSSSEHVYPQYYFIATSERPTSGHIRKNSSISSKSNSLRLAAWLVYGNQKAFQTKLQSLYQIPEYSFLNIYQKYFFDFPPFIWHSRITP